jgi:hypothetical protein
MIVKKDTNKLEEKLVPLISDNNIFASLERKDVRKNGSSFDTKKLENTLRNRRIVIPSNN